jgi:26S proteasome regulatory subunit N11
MLGEFVDDYTVRVIDVFAMPQSGTGVSVEAVDPVFQAKMLDMLKQTGRPEMVVGWYHSHPGFGCWLSGVDINTQQSFEALTERTVVSFLVQFKNTDLIYRLLLLIRFKVSKAKSLSMHFV